MKKLSKKKNTQSRKIDKELYRKLPKYILDNLLKEMEATRKESDDKFIKDLKSGKFFSKKYPANMGQTLRSVK